MTNTNLPRQESVQSESTRDVKSDDPSITKDSATPRETDSDSSKCSGKVLTESEKQVAGLVGLGLALAALGLFFWIGPIAMRWIEDRWNRSTAPTDALSERVRDLQKKQLLGEEAKPSRILDLEADRAEYEGRMDEANRLRGLAANSRKREQEKAADEKEFQEWRKKKYGESLPERNGKDFVLPKW